MAGSSLDNEGRLEVKYGEAWGTVCIDYFDYIDAGVVFNSLGLGFVYLFDTARIHTRRDSLVVSVFN